MEDDETNARQPQVEKFEIGESDSAENFQKFIYELFNKNGILNDLRAYLRGHIVNVLKSVQTGDPPSCQKHFTQRLELESQALNILIAEYLLQLEFTYSLSVFVSEIPLSNMVFDFAKTLLNNRDGDPNNLRFKDSDVWSVLNYLGLKCDSEHALNIVEMYKSEDQIPLLSCILRCVPMYRKESVYMEEENSSKDSLTSSIISMDTLPDKRSKEHKVHRQTSCYDKCKHYSFCKSCQNRVAMLKQKYRERKRSFRQNERKSNINPLNVENFMKNIDVMEKRIINEMFEQLKMVYEAEVDMVRQEEAGRVKRSLASHALQLQQRQEEIEETLKSREAELESRAQQKKQFLWGVARTLRDQHAHVARAMSLLRDEQEELAQKENNLQSQVRQAEESLRQKGEEMRAQISSELEILQVQFESMKLERDKLDKERQDLENMKSFCDSKSRMIEAHSEKEKEDLRQDYDLLKEEISVLKKFIESTKVEPKCLFEKSTMTEFVEIPLNTSILNNTNSQENRSRTEINDTRPPNQVMNDLKKQKNVNFSQSKLDEVFGEPSRRGSQSSASSEGAPGEEGARDDVIAQLMRENDSLKHYAAQLRSHTSALWRERAHAASVPRPRPAPAAPAANYFTVHGVNPSTSARTFGWRKGAGEELSLFTADQSQVLLPGDPLPFVGVLRDRHDNRRHLNSQWHALRRRSSPLAGVSKPRAQPARRAAKQRDTSATMEPSLPAVHIRDEPTQEDHGTVDDRQETRDEHSSKISRQKSPKTVLKEAKKNLRNKSCIKEKPPILKREKSPNSMLREAKLRLRKLEIEAEAVEKSYLDFRKRQEELREERTSLSMLEHELVNDDIVRKLDVSRSRSSQNLHDNNRTKPGIPSQETIDQTNRDFEKYLRDYQATLDIGQTHFKNKNSSVDKAKPIPEAYAEVNTKNNEIKGKNYDYISTPLMEFRKLYHAERRRDRPRTSIEKYGVSVSLDIDKLSNFKKDVKIEEQRNTTNLNINRNPEGAESEILNDFENLNNNDVERISSTKVINNLNEKRLQSEIPKDQCNVSNIPGEENSNSNATEDIREYKKFESFIKINNSKVADLDFKEKFYEINQSKSPPLGNTMPVEEFGKGTINGIENKVEHHIGDKNILRVEVESSCEVNKVKMSESPDDDLVIVVQSSVTTNNSDDDDQIHNLSPITIHINPKEGSLGSHDHNIIKSPNSTAIDSPDKTEQLMRPEIFHAVISRDDNDISKPQTYDNERIETIPKSKSSPKNTPRLKSIQVIHDLSKHLDQQTARMKSLQSTPSDSPEKAAHLTRTDALNAIFNTNDKDLSSVDMHLDISKDNVSDSSDEEKDLYEDYPDDFSQDVDNYNSRSEYDNSPISLPKSSEQENFWDN